MPAVSAHDGGFHVAYQGEDNKYYYAHFDGTTWNPKAEPIPIAGNKLGTLASLGGNAVYVTQDKEQANALVVMERAPTWQAPVTIEAGGGSTRPSMVAMVGEADLMVLRSGNYFVRKAGQWTTSGQMPGVSPSTAITPGLAGLKNGDAAAAWRNNDDTIAVSLYDMATDTWAEPVMLGSSPAPRRSPPASAPPRSSSRTTRSYPTSRSYGGG